MNHTATPITGAQLRDAGAQELREAADHVQRAENHLLVLADLARGTPAGRRRTEVADGLHRVRIQLLNCRTDVVSGEV